MNKKAHFFRRIYMFFFYTFARLLKWREPVLLTGDNPIEEIPKKIKELGLKRSLVVLDPIVESLGLSQSLTHAFIKNDINYKIFNKVKPNPKISDIEDGLKIYMENFCDSIVVMGGGSALDTAKAIGARIARPDRTIEQMKGLFKVGKDIPTLFAIPTTAGTGSEATIASVVTDNNQHKYAINDLHLIPNYAVLEPKLTTGLPKEITAQTGMDALTHAVEGYISKGITKKYEILAVEAIKQIFNNIKQAYDNGSSLDARGEMLEASYKAGVVFTRCGLTYVHPIAHTLGGLYNVPHGLANAILLPICLRKYGEKIYKKLAYLYDAIEPDSDLSLEKDKALKFIEKIDELNNYMNIGNKFKIDENDIPKMIEWAMNEANTQYYPPVILDSEDIEEIIREIKL
ncbi:iron-containing alcohol dehydrogenase [bacterium]|nr:iron-containing alcohol dehydrogenase [bacterium]